MKTFHVIPHTHWDYEWYFSANESLIQLVYHLDEVMDGLESDKNDTYLLDGQYSIIEDYFQACPEKKARFSRLVREGKLIVGPWYTQTDQLIISGESITRNLMYGIQGCEDIGACMLIGYVPDAFGQSIDMPKIYNGVGIDRTVFWRGLSEDVCASREFIWQAKDGSQVTAYNIKNGYFVGSHIMYEDDPTPLCEQANEGSLSNHVGIPLGGDQRFIDLEVKERIKISNQVNKNGVLIESHYDALFDEIEKQQLQLPTIQGEFIDGQVSKIHRSIYSTRYDHKQYNDKLETRLVYQLEPLMALASFHGIEAKQSMLDSIWKLVLRNHAHDSAGGCNTDNTNQMIMQRFKQADEMSASMVDYLVRKLAESQSQDKEGLTRLTLMNTLPYSRDGVFTTQISTLSPEFSIVNDQGDNVPFDLIHSERHYRGSIKRTAAENDPSLYYYESKIQLKTAIPALGFCALWINENSASNATTPLIRQDVEQSSDPCLIENDRYSLRFDKQSGFTLLDKTHQRVFGNCLTLVDMGDDGDNYDYSPPEHDWHLTFDWSTVDVSLVTGQFAQILKVKGEWKLPLNLAERANKMVSTTVRFTLALTLNQSDGLGDLPLKITLNIDNKVEDHRMQLVFTTPFDTISNWADTPYGVVERPNIHPHLHDWRKLGWKEEPSSIYPMLSYTNVHNEHGSISLLSKGIKEYEIKQDGQLALTLFRSVGWLGKPDLQRRPGIASGQQFKWIPSPNSQLLTKLNFEIAVLVEGTFDPSRIQKIAQLYSVDILDYQKQELNQFTNTLKYFVMHPLANTVPNYSSLCCLNSNQVVLSSLKLANDGNGLILRLHNPHDEEINQAGFIEFVTPVKVCSEVDLLERELNVLPHIVSKIILDNFKAKQIRTIRICI